MDKTQEAALDKHLKQVEAATGKKVACPICSSDQLRFGMIVAQSEIGGAAMRVGPVNPGAVAQLICDKCGHVLYFDCKITKVPVL